MYKETSTLVTGLWNLNRESLQEGWKRSFEDHYIANFIKLLQVPNNLIIFGEKSLKKVVFEHRSDESTLFIERDLKWFKNEFFDKIQEIRNNPEWYNQASWLKSSTQGSLELYNPVVMSKMFLLNDARILDKFNSKNLFWIDAGIANTVHPGYFTHDKVLDKLENIVDKFTFIAFPYKPEKEIHGFTYPEINKFANNDVKLVCRGGFFGGPKGSIEEVNGMYYSLLATTLNKSLMGTEESLFSILLYKHPDIFSYYKIESNGLLSKFFEDLKEDQVKFISIPSKNKNTTLDYKKVGLYVITYNSPAQFEKLCQSFEKYDSNLLKLPRKFLLNNSIDRSTDEKYKELCSAYGFEEIKKDNIGICGGRQFIAEHFDNQKDLDYYHFFEDDMFFYDGDETVCKNGFNRHLKDFYKKTLDIIYLENFDFLKLNFTEFFGDNTRQWAWHNVPQSTRKQLFPDNPVKATNERNQEPFLEYKNIKSYKQIPYASGAIYYCNWPQIVSREGNHKMFIETKWEYPYEQTWMSFIYQETIKENIKPGILLATPTEHDRFDHYSGSERREN